MFCGLLLASMLRGAQAQASSPVPANKPFQVVRPTSNHSAMVPVAEALRMLSQHEESISVVSVVGPYHSGKSFLLNALVGDTSVFQVGRKTLPETMGIWLCRTNLRAGDGSEVWLLDSEGFFGPGVAESYDAKIFTVASLLGAHLVYNTVKIIDQQAVSLLEMLARRAQLFRTRSAAEPANAETPEFLSVRSFPPLTWVVEDFVQELPAEHRGRDGATAWLKSYLATVNDTAEPEGTEAHFLARLYSELRVHTLFLPATKREHLQDLSRLTWKDLTPEFKEELEDLRSQIISGLQARRFEGRPMTGRTLERALRFIVQALQRGMFHELPSLWATWTAQVAEMSLQDAERWFESLLAAIDAGENPTAVAALNREVEDARERAVFFYKELLHDFEVRPDLSELRKRMGVHFQAKLILYHERVQRWVGQLISYAKEELGSLLATSELPINPDVLKSTCEANSKRLVKDFEAHLRGFAQRGAPVKLGKEATMPGFSTDPVEQLRTDLRTLQGSKELENEREVMKYFQAAVAAADDAVEREIKSQGNRLLGTSKMTELQNFVAVKCWQAFDDRLTKHEWMKVLTHYKTHKALVQTEHYEAKMQRFKASNDQRLASHYRAALDRCVASYRARKANLAMPVSETDLDAEHRQLASGVREMLDEQGRELMDTGTYKGTLSSLNEVLEEGLLHLRKKNVELWKVHSDEATRCALKENQAVERRCGLLCLFNKVPMVHKATSQKHLFACFPRSGTGARMSTSMQMQVFEDWYNKDLAHDAATVWNNFYIGTALIGLCGILLASACKTRRPQPVVPSYYQQGYQQPAVGYRSNKPAW